MKIAHINMFYLPTFGGVEQVMYELAKRQVKDGHEVHVFCCDSDKNNRIKIKEEMIDGVHVHRLKYWFRLSLSTHIWPSLSWKLRKYDFDVIHSHVSGHAYHLFAGLSKKKAAYVHTTHCPWTDAFRPRILKPFLWLNNKIFNRWSFSLMDKIIAITPWELSTLEKWVDRNKIVVIENGMDDGLFKKIVPNNFKKNHNIKGKIVLFFGRLNPTKGPEKLALVGKEILKNRDDIYFVFIGPDEGKLDEVKKIIKDQKNMMYLGAIRGIPIIAEMYQACDIYVLPSYREGLPLTLFEAMACGLPIIASPVNGVPYAMKEPENGFFVKYGDIEGLKEKILMLIDNKKLRKNIGENNIKKSKNYSWDLIYKKYMNVYDEAIKLKK